MIEIGERIKALRKQKNITQEELAEHMNVSRQSISKWESNQTVPDIEKIIGLSRYFDTSTDYLLKGTKTEKEPGYSDEKTEEAVTKKRNHTLIISISLTALSGIALFIIWVLSKIYKMNNLPYNDETGLYRTGIDAFTYVHDIKGFYYILIAGLIVGIILTVYSIVKKKIANNHS